MNLMNTYYLKAFHTHDLHHRHDSEPTSPPKGVRKALRANFLDFHTEIRRDSLASGILEDSSPVNRGEKKRRPL